MHYNLIMHHCMVRFFCAEEVMLSLYDMVAHYVIVL